MRLKKAMKNFYGHEVCRHDIPPFQTSISPAIEIRVAAVPRSSLFLNFAFNGALATIAAMAVVMHLNFKSPLGEVIHTVDLRYGIEGRFQQVLNQLPGILQDIKGEKL